MYALGAAFIVLVCSHLKFQRNIGFGRHRVRTPLFACRVQSRADDAHAETGFRRVFRSTDKADIKSLVGMFLVCIGKIVDYALNQPRLLTVTESATIVIDTAVSLGTSISASGIAAAYALDANSTTAITRLLYISIISKTATKVLNIAQLAK